MPYIQQDGQQHPLVPGDNTVGAAAAARVRVAGAGVGDTVAVLAVGADGSTVIRRHGDSAVKVNGVRLGAEPTPLIHGDKIEIDGRELFFGDDRKAGNTQYVPSVRIPETAAPAHVAARPTAAAGGRLLSLVDGREYPVPERGLVIGRDPACDVVVPAGAVSRRHAVIAPGRDGYILTDTSTNGVLVNGASVASPTVLGRGDVLTVGGEEFRFYADAAAPAPAPAPAPVPAAPAETRVPLAMLEVMGTGVMQGRTFEIHSPLTHIGRGAHNDVVVPDESVSDTHAKIQRRETGWWVVDVDSTNGTYVGGRRITGEARLMGVPVLRFGGVKFIFRSAEQQAAEAAGQTRAIAALSPELRQRLAEEQSPPASRQHAPAAARPAGAPREQGAPAPAPASSPSGGRRLYWLLLLAALAAGAYLLLARG
ncbi:MAG TPA: FHA domain-containing protein [Gemmatimonadaceae bacterium]|nr:FHA domain-containing protein [Gemmatimonadaceae bacterium]